MSQRRTPAPGSRPAGDVDPGDRALAHRQVSGTGQRGEQLAEVRVVADDDRPSRPSGVAQQRLDILQVEPAGEPFVDPDLDAQVAGDDLGGPQRPDLGRADHGVRREPAGGEETAEALGLTLALVGQGSGGIGSGPRLGIAGVGVAQEVQFDHAGTGPRAGDGLRDEGANVRLDLTEDGFEDRPSLVVRAGRRGRILQVPVDRLVRTRGRRDSSGERDHRP